MAGENRGAATAVRASATFAGHQRIRMETNILGFFHSLLRYGVLAFVAAAGLAAQTNAPSLPDTPITLTLVARGLEHPWSLQFLPDGRMLVSERPGRLRVIRADGSMSDPVTGLPR